MTMALKKVYLLTSARAPWRRAGLLFTSVRTPLQVDAADLDEAQVKLLEQDPAITIRLAEVDADAPPQGVVVAAPAPHPAFVAAQKAEEARAEAYAAGQARAVEATRAALDAGRQDTDPKGATGAPASAGGASPQAPSPGASEMAPGADAGGAGNPPPADETSKGAPAPAGEGSAGGASAPPADPKGKSKAATSGAADAAAAAGQAPPVGDPPTAGGAA